MVNSYRQLLWLALCSFVAAQETDTLPPTSAPTAVPWGGCEDPINGKRKVTIGEKTTICLTIADGANWSEARTYMRVNFQPIADQYSRFVVPRSFQELITDSNTAVSNIFEGKNITVHAASQTALSVQRKYYDVSGKVFPFLTAIIAVQDGVVAGITWDDASIFCGLKQVERNVLDFEGRGGNEDKFEQPVDACYFQESQCQSEKESCDLLLNVVWTGTDSEGRSFLSSSYRYSAFPPQEWADRLTGLLPDVNVPDVDLNPLNRE